MRNRSGRRASFGPGAVAVVGAVLLVAVSVVAVYRSIVARRPTTSSQRSVESTEGVFVSREPPRVIPAVSPMTVPVATADVVTPSGLRSETESASMDQPFVEARQEPRNSIWALQTESSLREALVAVRETVTVQGVQCASVRCTLEGTIGRGGQLQDLVRAINKAGLKTGRFKRSRGDDGTTTFSAVFAREGYKLDGSPKEASTKPL